MRPIEQILTDGLPPPRLLHRHPWHEVIVVRRGCYRAEHGGIQLALRPGQAVWWPARCAHRPRPAARGTELLLLRWADAPVASDTAAVVLDDHHGRLLAAAAWLWEAFNGVYADPSLTAALIHCVRAEVAHLATPRADLHLGAVNAWALAHLAERIDRDGFARGVGWSASRLRDHLRQHIGMSPIGYLRHLRVQRAMQLITGTRQPFADIARAVGAGNADVLARWVRAATGRAPRAWRTLTGAAAQATMR